jgi:hypothetical protein
MEQVTPAKASQQAVEDERDSCRHRGKTLCFGTFTDFAFFPQEFSPVG